MTLSIHTEYDRHQTHIRRLVEPSVQAGVDPFDGCADFTLPSEVELLREQVACLEASRRRALEHLAPVKKATKDVLLGKIECARDELARVMEG